MEKGTIAFTAKMNDYMNEVVKLCSQYIYALQSSNPLDEYFPVETVSNGRDVEISVIAKAEAQAFDKTGANIWKDHAPQIATEWNPDAWDEKQFIVTLRTDEIRDAMMTNKSPEETAAKIIDTITQGCENYRYKKVREIMTLEGFFKDYAAIGKYTAKTLSGVLYICKDAYNHLKASNADSTPGTTIEMETPAADIYTLIPTKVIDLLDTVVRRYRREYDYSEDRNNTGRFSQQILYNDELNFACGLFKAVEIDATAACTAKLAEIATKTTPGG